MPLDKKRIYAVCICVLSALLLSYLLPDVGGRILAAFLLPPLAVIAFIVVKKRAVPSVYSSQAFMIIGTGALMYLVLYYLSAFRFGLVRTGYGFKADIIFRLALPILVIIVSIEIIRYVLVSQHQRYATVFAYVLALIADLIICTGTVYVSNFSSFMDVIGLTLAPGILYNLLFNYVSGRYGFLPIIVYRALTSWIFYLIPYGSGIHDSLLAFINLLIPIGLYIFLRALFEPKRRYALGNRTKAHRIFSGIFTVAFLVAISLTVMLISNQFRYGACVIATESMTGELNKGDVAIIKMYEEQDVDEGQVIAFEKGSSVFVHRVVAVEVINGTTRYYTAGDANEDRDAGYITDGDIIGTVDNKISYIGYPTLWLRSLFSR